MRDDGTYASRDGGESWTRLDVVGSLTDIVTAGQWMFISTDRAFYRSATGSGTFEPLLDSFGAAIYSLETDSSETMVFAGSIQRVLRSTDYGITFTRPGSTSLPCGPPAERRACR